MKTDQGKNKLYRFRVRFKRSKYGKLWIKTRTTVFASSDILAIKAIRSKYPYFKDPVIISFREITQQIH